MEPCIHIEIRNRGAWHWCPVRAKQVTPRIDCGPHCRSYQSEGEIAMPTGDRIQWDAPASGTVLTSGIRGPEDISLREWCRARREAGESTADLAAALGCHVQTLQRAMRAEPSAPAPKPAAVPPSPERRGAGGEAADPADDGASVFAAITFIKASGLWEQFEGFCLCLRWQDDRKPNK